MNQYRKTFEFFSTEQQAAAFVAARKKQRRKAHMTEKSPQAPVFRHGVKGCKFAECAE